MSIMILIFGFCAGAAIIGGAFAFITKIGVYPRMIGRTKTARDLAWYENMIGGGLFAGTIFSVFPEFVPQLGVVAAGIYGYMCGVMVGCISAALAEVLNVFPVLFRKFKITEGMYYYITILALGKGIGAFLFFALNFSN